jgi:hypothetical protein
VSARVRSLCGTARGIASRKNASEQKRTAHRPCRFAAFWACQGSGDRKRRLVEPPR